MAVIHEWRETGHRVHIYSGGKSAVVTYLFTITVVTNVQKQTMQGRDMLFQVKAGRKWQVVADQIQFEIISGIKTPASSA